MNKWFINPLIAEKSFFLFNRMCAFMELISGWLKWQWIRIELESNDFKNSFT